MTAPRTIGPDVDELFFGYAPLLPGAAFPQTLRVSHDADGTTLMVGPGKARLDRETVRALAEALQDAADLDAS
jgi:hypothetical protein